MLQETYRRYTWYNIVAMLLPCSALHSYRIIVSNETNEDICARIYRQRVDHEFLIATSAVKNIPAGKTMWFGGVLASTDTTQFLLYGSCNRDDLTEALSTKSSLTEPRKLFDVGTGVQLFIISAEPQVEMAADALPEPSNALESIAYESLACSVDSELECSFDNTFFSVTDDVVLHDDVVLGNEALEEILAHTDMEATVDIIEEIKLLHAYQAMNSEELLTLIPASSSDQLMTINLSAALSSPEGLASLPDAPQANDIMDEGMTHDAMHHDMILAEAVIAEQAASDTSAQESIAHSTTEEKIPARIPRHKQRPHKFRRSSRHR